MFTHAKYKARGLNMPYYKALEAGYITYDEYCDLKGIKKDNKFSGKQERDMTPLEEELGHSIE